MNTFDIMDSTIDPWQILGIGEDADDAQIEAAWKEHSSRGRNREKVHQAYRMIAHEEDRARLRLLSPGIPASLEAIKDDMPLRTRYTGPSAWYGNLKEVLRKELSGD